MNIFKQPVATIWQGTNLLGEFPIRDINYKNNRLEEISVLIDIKRNNKSTKSALNFYNTDGKLICYHEDGKMYKAKVNTK